MMTEVPDYQDIPNEPDVLIDDEVEPEEYPDSETQDDGEDD